MARQTSKAVVARDQETAISPTLLQQAEQRIAVAEKVAELLTATIEKHKLYSVIVFKKREGGKVVSERKSKHVRFEGWTTAGALLEFIMGDSVHPITVSTEPIPYPEGKGPSDYPQGAFGYKAHVEARTSDGRVLGGAETSVTRDESRWRNADDYAIQSMAQTRAGSKALRAPLGWLVALAGFDQTPAEEMDGLRADSDRSTRPPARRAAQPAKNGGWACSDCGRGSLEWQKEEPGRKPIPSSESNCPQCGHVRGAKSAAEADAAAATRRGESAIEAGEGISAGANGQPVDVTPEAAAQDDVVDGEAVDVTSDEAAAENAESDAVPEARADADGVVIEEEANTDDEAADDAEAESAAEAADGGSPYP